MAGRQKTSQGQVMGDVPITSGIGSAATFLGDMFHIRILTSSTSKTKYELVGRSGYDSNPRYREITSWTNRAGIGFPVPAPTDETITIGEKTWNIVERSVLGDPKMIKISDGKQTVKLKDGERINVEGATGPNKNWKVLFFKSDNIWDAQGLRQNTSTEHVWIYHDDPGEYKFKPGDAISLPTYFGGKLKYDGTIKNETMAAEAMGLQSYTYNYKDPSDGTIKQFTGPMLSFWARDGIKLIVNDNNGKVVGTPSEVFINFGDATNRPKLILFKKPGNDYYDAGSIMSVERWTEIGTGFIVHSNGNAELSFTEKIRPSGTQCETSLQIRKAEDGSYSLGNKGGVVNVAYREPMSNPYPVVYEVPFITNRGSKYSLRGTNQMRIDFSKEIAQAQWSLSESGEPTGVRDLGTPIPREAALKQNYPNPFNPVTTIGFTLNKDGHVTIKVYNTLSQEVARLADEQPHMAGSHEVRFDASTFPTGIYFYTLNVDGKEIDRKKMSFIK